MKPEIDIYNPDQLGAPLGLYKHMTRVKANEFLFIAGQLAANKSGESVGRGDFEAQMRQVFANIEAALQSADAGWDNVVRFTTYLVHSQDIENFMAVRSELFPQLFTGDNYPPNTLLIVDRLVKEEFLIEVDTVAAV